MPFDTWVLAHGTGWLKRAGFPGRVTAVPSRVPGSGGCRMMEVVVSKTQQCSDTPFKANPCARGSASSVGMFWRRSAPCRVMPPGTGPAAVTLLLLFLELCIYLLMGEEAARPCSLPKGLLGWGCVWKWDQRAKGKRHQPALARAQNTGCPG